MSHYKKHLASPVQLAIIAFSTLFLINCTSIQHLDTAADEQSNSLAIQAQEALSAQQFSLAAQLYVQLADSHHAPLKDQYTISAIQAFLKANDLSNANTLIDTLKNRSSQLSTEIKLTLADILLTQGKAERAIELIMSINESNLPSHQRINLHTLASSAFSQAGNLIESARERIVLNALINQPSEKLKNQTKLLDTLSLIPEHALTFLKPTADRELAGWIDLTLLAKRQSAFNPHSPEVDLWKQQYPDHAANSSFLSMMATQAQQHFKTAHKVGVFLPTQGPFAQAAFSIRKGITAAAYSLAHRWPMNIVFYDTSASSIDSLYQQALNDGVNVIIGPLEKANIASITNLVDLPIPIIGLNKNSYHRNKHYYEFSLSPEEDVTQILNFAWLKGHEKALILTPQSNSGERLARHFSTIWQQLGGEVLGVQTYPVKQADYSSPIKSLLQIDDSIHRFKQLRQRLNLNIKFEERRRHDADFIFLVADPREGRLIKPQLRFHRASKLAVFSTSKIYEGELNRVANRDLDGIFFCDMPWLIDTHQAQNDPLTDALSWWKNTRGLHRRLTAFGYDAYQLIPRLTYLKTSRHARYDGKTGILSMKNNVINRQLNCGQFKAGNIKPLGLAPHLERTINLLPTGPTRQDNLNTNTSPL